MLSEFKKALRFDPNQKEAAAYLKAIEKISETPVTEDIPPEIAEKYSNGIMYFNSKRLDKAIVEWEYVWNRYPQYKEVAENLINAYLFKGMEYYSSGKLEDAVKTWEKILRIEPNHEKATRYINNTKEEIIKLDQIK